MTKLAPEWVRTSDPVIRSPACYRWTTAPAGGPVGHLGTLFSSTYEPAILVDPGGTSPSSDLAEMLLPAIPGSPVGFSSDLARMRGPAPPAESAVRRGLIGPAVSSETLLPGVDVPGLCQIVLTVGLWPEVAVPLPAMWDPLFASLLVEPLKMTGADVVGRSRAVRGGWSGPDVAGTSAVVDLGAASDRAVECLAARDGGGRHVMVDDRPIYELTSYELYILFSGGPATSGVVM